ncbi:hypothetical protein AVEN_243360-1 [Araneus ventricosus]|uniref:Mutator-like transposase domain-containing protein n=1 Tax=Araneus ventricosus TaxID=182803 RepID=A0A4Y2RXT9_ARAVE|nr:hypothetical protein AVEN_243360-1 [Araneus ventricosus]
MNNSMWPSLLSNTKCDECNMCSLDVTSNGTYGFSSKIELNCKNCEKVFNSIFSSPRDNFDKCFEANKKLVEVFLKIGKGHAAVEVFSMAIGIHAMDEKTFSKCLHKLYEEKQSYKDDILQVSRKIVRQKHNELASPSDQNNEIIDMTVSYDGAWQKRGHTSLYGIEIVVDILTGLVIDYEILSKYCPECTAAKRDFGEQSADFSIWYKAHKPECAENYVGSSNAMEVKAAEILWTRSVENCGMRYMNVLSVGDSKTHQNLLDVYGDNMKTSKEECLNHVAKRLGTGLRNKVKEWRSKGVTIGGRKEESLKENTILKLTNFYRKTIKGNVPDVQKMKTAIFASLFHTSSSDKAPKHNKCPTGVTSWCFYQRALANNERPKSHSSMKTKLSEQVLEKILPVYQRLANNELLARCVSGKTQNVNESIHSVIWNNCPKETFVSKKRLELAVISAIGECNFGCLNNLSAEQNELNSESIQIAQRRDERRIAQSESRGTEKWKRKRISKKLSKSTNNTKIIKKRVKHMVLGNFN